MKMSVKGGNGCSNHFLLVAFILHNKHTVQYSEFCVKNIILQKGSVAQLVEWQIRDLREVGSSPPGVFGAAAAEFAEFDQP